MGNSRRQASRLVSSFNVPERSQMYRSPLRLKILLRDREAGYHHGQIRFPLHKPQRPTQRHFCQHHPYHSINSPSTSLPRLMTLIWFPDKNFVLSNCLRWGISVGDRLRVATTHVEPLRLMLLLAQHSRDLDSITTFIVRIGSCRNGV